MAARLSRKDEREGPVLEAPSQRKQPEGRFRLQVDRQTKAAYLTFAEAEAAGTAIKKTHPILQVAVYDHAESVNKIIQIPEE